jgi:hypothetical protein
VPQKQAASSARAELAVFGEIVGLAGAAVGGSGGSCSGGGSFSCSWEVAYDPKHFELLRGEARVRRRAGPLVPPRLLCNPARRWRAARQRPTAAGWRLGGIIPLSA